MPIDFFKVFFGGIRVRKGFLRLWIFTVFKVLLIASLLSGYNVALIFRDNIALLDQYIRDDIAATENHLILDKKIVDIQPAVR